MSYIVIIDWKFIVALGASAFCIICAAKIDATAAGRVTNHFVDAYMTNAYAQQSIR